MLNLKIIIGGARPGRLFITPALMNMPATQPGTPTTVSPSRLVRATFGPLTWILNPAIVKLAGRRHVRFAARISHTGRRSGRRYVTPVSARLAGDTFIIPLTFGNQSDWSRNVRSAGCCEIRLNGTDYRAVRPELADGEQVREVIRAAFSPVERIMLRMLGIRQFLLLQRARG
jgi:deazaflavin-dependent oxidoreductase (nitroreductase family)